jgi:hypothetical protein
VQVAVGTRLAQTITDHTNNQNGTTARDLKSNNPIQSRLQTEVNTGYDKQFRYRIKRGEHPEWDKDKSLEVIENEMVARVLLAFDLKQPWVCHQTYKLFDELHAAIFGRPDVTGDRIVALWGIYKASIDKLALMQNSLFAHYGLTKFLMLHLVREALITDSLGSALYQQPSAFLEQNKGQERIAYATGKLAQTLARVLDREVTRRSTPDPYDFKRELKSQRSVVDLTSTVVAHYQIAVDSELAPTFSKLWEESKSKKKRK